MGIRATEVQYMYTQTLLYKIHGDLYIQCLVYVANSMSAVEEFLDENEDEADIKISAGVVSMVGSMLPLF